MLGCPEGSVLLERIGPLLQRVTSPRSRNVTNHRHKKTNSTLGKVRQQRNMFQTKEQDKTPEEELSEVETGNLLEKEFRVMI